MTTTTLQDTESMYQLQLKFHNQGDWENTVYSPVSRSKAESLLRYYQLQWSGVHSYRIISVS